MAKSESRPVRMATYEIHPRIGVARLGNSPNEFYLAPEEVGGLPIVCDENGNEVLKEGKQQYVRKFKDEIGRIKRQAAKFKIFKKEGRNVEEINLSSSEVKKIEWTVHLANKKPIWYTFSELLGDLNFGESNSYENTRVPVNNPEVTDLDERKQLIIDPGPRSISRVGASVDFSRYNIPGGYRFGSFPPLSTGGQQINTLGTLKMDKEGHLVALGAHGNVSGSADISSFRGAAGYWDDISDGYVLATIHFKDGKRVDVDPAWLLIGSPKYAPELVNITTMYDTVYDTSVRKMDANTNLFKAKAKSAYNYKSVKKIVEKIEGSATWMENDIGYTVLAGFKKNYIVNYERDIKPIIDRMSNYRWVGNVPSMLSFTNPSFSMTDASEENLKNRWNYFRFFRVPLLPDAYAAGLKNITNGPNQLFAEQEPGIPLMPINSGDNSVTNSGPIYKFETLSPTQYFYFFQWAIGKFEVKKVPSKLTLEQLNEAHTGNCVGAPFSPGIETTWIIRNPKIYHDSGHLKVAHFEGNNHQIEQYYEQNGLSTTADEGEGFGCEPGDITKRMAIPWQADFQECTVQTPNISIPDINQFVDGSGIEVPPAYYVYWWPPQSPMHVITGSTNPQDQVLDAILSAIDGQPIIPAGQRVDFQRGIYNISEMITNWFRLGFIVNQGLETLPNFVETERDFQAFGQLAAVKHGQEIQSRQFK